MSNFVINPSRFVTGSGFDMTGLKAYYKFCNDPTASNLINQASTVGSSVSNGADLSNSNVTTATGLIDEGYDYDVSNGQSAGTGGAGSGDPPEQFESCYGPTTVGDYALTAQRHMHEFGTTIPVCTSPTPELEMLKPRASKTH